MTRSEEKYKGFLLTLSLPTASMPFKLGSPNPVAYWVAANCAQCILASGIIFFLTPAKPSYLFLHLSAVFQFLLKLQVSSIGSWLSLFTSPVWMSCRQGGGRKIDLCQRDLPHLPYIMAFFRDIISLVIIT